MGFPGGSPESWNLEALSKAVTEMRDQLNGKSKITPGRRDRRDDRQEDRGGPRRAKSKKKKDRRGSSSSSGRRRRRRKGGSSSSSSSTDYVRWQDQGKNRTIRPRQVQNFATRRFKDQADVLAFATQHPGALSAAFLQMVHQKYTQIMMGETKDLRSHNLVEWAALHCTVTEKRDQRELATLCLAMDCINARRLASAMDVLAQRVNAIQVAKGAGGSWEKAARIELTLPSGANTTSSGLLRLTQ